ncbi:MAG: 2-C-methyl-D-erythritol 4-phosphate cytidylyltransferase [Rhodoluna sp.]|nr:2-C-methyl-D-erythritol 4-phosphate cytidylyltransferase [Rhodoluna sp.]
MTQRSVAVVLLAAGKGERLGAKAPKAFVELAGKSLLEHSVFRALATDNLKQLIIAVPESHLTQTLEFEKQLSNQGVDIRVVVGGATRQQSVSESLAVLAGGIGIVLVHDSARSLASTDLFNRVAQAVFDNQIGVIPALHVADTIKRYKGDVIQETIERSDLVRAQTPQGFPASVLVAAHVGAAQEFTDDAALIQSIGGTVMMIEGEEQAMKITTAEDFERAQTYLLAHARTGIGSDAHRYSEDKSKTLYLGGLEWPGELALEGHSDGDVISHAIVDSLLSAANLGDIGSNFGVDRPEYSGASGEVFLKATLELLKDQDFEPVNVSVQLIGNRPKLAPRRLEVETHLGAIIGAPVSVSATTTDGMGFLGSDEGLAAVATSLVRKVGLGS